MNHREVLCPTCATNQGFSGEPEVKALLAGKAEPCVTHWASCHRVLQCFKTEYQQHHANCMNPSQGRVCVTTA